MKTTKRVVYWLPGLSFLAVLSALLMVCSAVVRIVWACGEDAISRPTLWLQIFLPIAANAVFALTILGSGRDRLYRTAVAVWLGCVFFAVKAFTFPSLLHTVLCLCGGIMLAGTVICLLLPSQLMGLFTQTPETIQVGAQALRIISGGFLVSAVSVASCGALEGAGKGTPSLVISLCRYLVVIVPAAFLLSRAFGPVGVWHAFWVAEALTALVAWVVYHRAMGAKKIKG